VKHLHFTVINKKILRKTRWNLPASFIYSIYYYLKVALMQWKKTQRLEISRSDQIARVRPVWWKSIEPLIHFIETKEDGFQITNSKLQ